MEGIQRFFERAVPLLTRPPKNVRSWGSFDFDNFRFIVWELFLYLVSLLLQFERFSLVTILINNKYYVEHARDFGKESYAAVRRVMGRDGFFKAA